MTDDDKAMAVLDDLLRDAAEKPPAPPAGLTARVLADADRVQPQAARPERRLGARGGSARWLPGGWQGLGGLVAATCAGFWIGISPPEVLPDTGAVLFGYETVDSSGFATGADGFGWDAEEG